MKFQNKNLKVTLLLFFIGIIALFSAGAALAEKGDDGFSITAAEYTLFLNATGAADPVHHYDEKMMRAAQLILREGKVGAYHYKVFSDSAGMSVLFLSNNDRGAYRLWCEQEKSSLVSEICSQGKRPEDCSNIFMRSYDPELKSNQKILLTAQEAAATQKGDSMTWRDAVAYTFLLLSGACYAEASNRGIGLQVGEVRNEEALLPEREQTIVSLRNNRQTQEQLQDTRHSMPSTERVATEPQRVSARRGGESVAVGKPINNSSLFISWLPKAVIAQPLLQSVHYQHDISIPSLLQAEHLQTPAAWAAYERELATMPHVAVVANIDYGIEEYIRTHHNFSSRYIECSSCYERIRKDKNELLERGNNFKKIKNHFFGLLAHYPNHGLSLRPAQYRGFNSYDPGFLFEQRETAAALGKIAWNWQELERGLHEILNTDLDSTLSETKAIAKKFELAVQMLITTARKIEQLKRSVCAPFKMQSQVQEMSDLSNRLRIPLRKIGVRDDKLSEVIQKVLDSINIKYDQKLYPPTAAERCKFFEMLLEEQFETLKENLQNERTLATRAFNFISWVPTEKETLLYFLEQAEKHFSTLPATFEESMANPWQQHNLDAIKEALLQKMEEIRNNHWYTLGSQGTTSGKNKK